MNAAAEAARRAEEARRRAEAARRAAEAARKAAEAARRAAEAARKAAEAAKGEQATKQAASTLSSAEKNLQKAEEKVALTAKQAEGAMRQANTLATKEKKAPPFTQKDLDGVKPRPNELVSAFEGSSRTAQLEKLLGLAAPRAQGAPSAGSSKQTRQPQQPPAALDAVDAKDAQAARKLRDGQTFTDPSSGTAYRVSQNAATGETVLSDASSGSTVTLKADGSYTSTVATTEKTKTGGASSTTWTKSSDAQGRTTRLESQQSATEQHPETGATTRTTTTRYSPDKSPPIPQSQTTEAQLERPPTALAQRPGTPRGPVTVKTETQFNEHGIATRQLKTTQVRTPGFDAKAVGAFEAHTGGAFHQAAKGADHYKTNNAPTALKPGQSSLTLTEETLYNAKGEPAVSKQKTESVALTAPASDKNGNGVQVNRTLQEVHRGPANAPSTADLPAISSRSPGTVHSSTTTTTYDPDGSTFDSGHASRTQATSRSSGTVDAQGQLQLSHSPLEVKSLQEGGDNRWTYDHARFKVGADGKPVAGQKPEELDRERQLPWHEDLKDFVASNLGELADSAGALASDALGVVKDTLLKPIDAVIDTVTNPLEDELAQEIEGLNSAGDTLTLSGGLDVKVGLKAGIEGEAEIERTADGKFVLSAEATGDVGVGLVGSASVSAGGRMELTFDSPKEAAKAAVILGKGPAAFASGGEDHKFLLQHLSAMEVNAGAGVEAGLGAKFGPGGAELSASLEATVGYRVEFNQGKPTHLVRTTELEGSAGASLATGLKGRAGLNLGGEVTGSVSIETKIPLDPSKVGAGDALAFIASPTTAAFAGPAETNITIEGSADGGVKGSFFKAEVAGLSGDEVQSVSSKLLSGDFETAFDDVKVDAKVTTGSFTDRELGMGAKLGVVDFNISARHRDVTAEGGNGNGSSTVSLSKRQRGGESPSGSDGSTGGPPPPSFRVNPATGRPMPVPATETGTSRPVPVVTNPELPGRTTHVRYDGGRVRIEAGPQATSEDIQAHMETARILQRYEGASGKVRQLIDRVKQALTGMPGYGSQGFESRLEVQKLNGILRSLETTLRQLDTSMASATGRPSPATAAERADLERQISSVEGQLRTHEAQVDSLTSGRGYVAREDDPEGLAQRAEALLAAMDEHYIYPPGDTAVERMQAPAREWETMPFHQSQVSLVRERNAFLEAVADANRLTQEARSATGPQRAAAEALASKARQHVRALIRRGVGGFTGDHMPSNRALIEANERGRLIDMTGQARDFGRKSRQNDGDTMLVTHGNHADVSRTYFRRNSERDPVSGEKRWKLDARDLADAARQDSEAWLQHLQQNGQLTPEITADFIKLYWDNVVHGAFERSRDHEEMLLGYLEQATPGSGS